MAKELTDAEIKLLDELAEKPEEDIEDVAPKKKRGRKSNKEHVYDLLTVMEASYISTPSGSAYITFMDEGVRKSIPLTSNKIITYLRAMMKTVKNKMVTKDEILEALYIMHSQHKVEINYEPKSRIARGKDGVIWIDLGLPSWDMVKVTPKGWSIEPYGGDPFILRYCDGFPLPTPSRNGSLAYLRPFVNGSYEEFIKVCGFIISSFNPEGPFPPLVITGTQGSAKSTLANLICKLLDNKDMLSTATPKVEDLILIASRNYILSFDNISTISTETSNALCRLVNGESISKRKLFTDGDLASYKAARPCILNGIGSIVSRGDLTNRSIFVSLDRVQEYKTLKEIEKEWEAVAPKIFGGLLDALVSSMNNFGKVNLTNKVRMADAVVWAEAAMVDLDKPIWSPGQFAELMVKGAQESDEDILDSDPLGNWITNELQTHSVIECSAQDLIKALLNSQPAAETRKLCPHTPKMLYKRLEELKPLLEGQDISYTAVRRLESKEGRTVKSRKIRISTLNLL